MPKMGFVRYQKAQKQYQCGYCNEPIEPGSNYCNLSNPGYLRLHESCFFPFAQSRQKGKGGRPSLGLTPEQARMRRNAMLRRTRLLLTPRPTQAHLDRLARAEYDLSRAGGVPPLPDWANHMPIIRLRKRLAARQLENIRALKKKYPNMPWETIVSQYPSRDLRTYDPATLSELARVFGARGVPFGAYFAPDTIPPMPDDMLPVYAPAWNGTQDE